MSKNESSAIVRSTIKSPEEQELDEKRRLIETLESEFATLQLDYSTLAGEIGAFRNRYYLRVGGLYAQLDILRAEIREIESRLNPDDEDAKAAAQDAREQADATCNEVNEANEERQVDFEPTPELKQLYRQAAKMIHPDRARDESDRQLRDRLMADINVAYNDGNADEIAGLIERYRAQLSAGDTDDIGAQLVRAIRSVARTRERIAGLVSAIDDLKNSEWARLKAEIEEGEIRGEDPLSKLAEKIHSDILAAQEKINSLLAFSSTDIAVKIATDEGEPPTQAEETTADTATHPKQSDNATIAFRPEGLIHRTERGEKVRSKSEAIIANILNNLGLDYRYEFPVEGRIKPGIRRPDFVVFDAEHRPILWEHLGMLDNEDYRNRWNAKLAWYEANGFTQGRDLFITSDDAAGGLDSKQLREVADHIRSLALP